MSHVVTPTAEQWATIVVEQNGADLLRYLVRRDSQDFGDMLNETLAIIWERRNHLPREPVEARMWSFGVARNVARRQYQRRTRRVRTLRSLDAGGSDTVSAAQESDPAHIAESNERHTAVRAALRALPEADRELIMLLHWDDFTIVDAAAVLRINPSTARTRYARAKKRLSAQLAQHSPVTPPLPRMGAVRERSDDRYRFDPNPRDT